MCTNKSEKIGWIILKTGKGNMLLSYFFHVFEASESDLEIHITLKYC